MPDPYQKRIAGLSGRIQRGGQMRGQNEALLRYYETRQAEYNNNWLASEIEQQNAQVETVSTGLELETEQAKNKNAAEGAENAFTTEQEFLQLSPEQRYIRRKEFTDRARRDWELSPSEKTKSTFQKFAAWEIEKDLSNYTPPEAVEAPTPNQSYIKDEHGYQRKTGEIPGVSQGRFETYNTDQADRDEYREDFAKRQLIDNETNPALKERLRKDYYESAAGRVASPDVTLPPAYTTETYKDKISKYQALNNRFEGFEELTKPIQDKILALQNKPENWAGRFSSYYKDLGDGAKGIIDRAKRGEVISDWEVKAVEDSAAEAVKASQEAKSNPAKAAYQPIPPSNALENFETFTPAQQARYKKAYPNFDWGNSPAAPTTKPTAPPARQQPAPGQTPPPVDVEKIVANAAPPAPPKNKDGAYFRKSTDDNRKDAFIDVPKLDSDDPDYKAALKQLEAGDENNTTKSEWFKKHYLKGSTLSYKDQQKVEAEAHSESAHGIAIERKLARMAVDAHGEWLQNKTPENEAKYKKLRGDVRRVRNGDFSNIPDFSKAPPETTKHSNLKPGTRAKLFGNL